MENRSVFFSGYSVGSLMIKAIHRGNFEVRGHFCIVLEQCMHTSTSIHVLKPTDYTKIELYYMCTLQKFNHNLGESQNGMQTVTNELTLLYIYGITPLNEV